VAQPPQAPRAIPRGEAELPGAEGAPMPRVLSDSGPGAIEWVCSRSLPAHERLCPQPVNATASANAFDGVIHPKVCRGRVLRDRAMASSCRCVH
jgi:hypothetical protein